MQIAQEYSHRFAREIINSTPELKEMYAEILMAIESINEEDLLVLQESTYKATKSISKAVNLMLRENFVASGWTKESKIFKGDQYKKENAWALDFAKTRPLMNANHDGYQDLRSNEIGIAVEVAFNHGEAAAWNILKPVLAAELNHVEKETSIGEGVGVLIVVSAEMENKGGFDGAVGNYERYMKHLNVMRNQLTVPMMIIALGEPKSFYVERYPKNHPVAKLRNRSTGRIIRIN